MTTVEFLAQLAQRGIQLWAEGERLRYRTAEGALPAELRAELVTRKAEILAFLAQAAAVALPAATIVPADRSRPLPLSFAQERLWFIDQWEPGRATYNLPQIVRLRGQLDSNALRTSLQQIVRRHEMLRTTFSDAAADGAQPGRPVQLIHPPTAVALPCHDLRDLPEPERSDTARRLVAAEIGQPFDLRRGPLLRATLIRTDDREHLLLLTLHHIVADGWSANLLLRELTTLYSSLASQSSIADALPDLPVQYADYAVWQRDGMAGDVLERELGYWRHQLGPEGTPAPALLELPTDRPRPARQTFNGTTASAQLPAALVAQLRTLSQREGTTLFQTLLAAFQVLLQRYSGQDDLVVGSPVSGRSQTEIEGLIGCFVNMLPLRLDLSGNPSFLALLQRVRALTLDAYAHQDVPFEKIVEAVQPARTLSHAPIFQVVFTLGYAVPGSYQLPGLELLPVALEQTAAKFDLELALSEGPDGLWASAEYNSDLFDPATIARLLEHYQLLLEQIAADPQQPIGALALLTAAERQLLDDWQGRHARYPVADTLHARFEAHAARTPDAIAVCCEGQRLSYRELNQRANQLAHQLKALGVGREVCVALWLDRSLDLVVAILGVLKAGGAYVPLDPAYPPERVALILADAQVPVLLTEAALRDTLWTQTAPAGVTAICLDRDWPALAQQPTSNLSPAGDPDQLAYIIYTSGSTGQPKGVLIPHGHVLRLFAATAHWFHFGPDDVWTLFHSAAFDFSVWELWGALLYGGRLVVVPFLLSRAPEQFYDLLRHERVTVLNQTPSAFRQLIQAEQQLGGRPGALALRLVIFGGEALELHSLRPWFERHGDAQPQLVNMYGITETTVHVTYRPLHSADLETPASLIGGPIADLQLYVLDRYGQPAPIGVPGELHVGGAGLARGYLGRPALTAERFIPDPFAERSGARLYRSGDLARWRADGELEYLGRIDQQVKVRGFRIELGEIEAVLQRHPAIHEVRVLARASAGQSEQRLVAYLVAADAPPPVEELRRFVKQHLPEYMVPSAFVWLDAFPLTTNGKLDRAALPSPDLARAALAAAYVAPRTPAEAVLADAWAEVLGIARVGIHDNFFGLGGDSIRSLQVVAAARARGVGLSLQQMFEHQTIAELSATLGDTEITAQRAPFELLSASDRARLPEDVEDAYPLSVLQSGMLFHGAASPEAGLYHDSFSFHLRAPFDPPALRVALQQLTVRHPVLRTSFELSRYDAPLQLVHRSAEVPLTVRDLRGLDPAACEAALAEAHAAEQRRPFDWTQAPLLRLATDRRSDTSFQFTISCHHALLDGWSVALLVGELFQLYLAALGRNVAPLAPAGQSFGDFVALEQQALADPAQLERWRSRLEGSALATVPRWGPPQPDADQRTPSVELELPADVVAGLWRLAQTIDVPLKSVLLAAHLRVLSLLSGQTDLVTGLVVNGRPETEHSERTLGMFLNTIPLRLQLSGGSWAELARAAFDAERTALPDRRYPLARLQQALGGQPLFETAFNFVHFHVLQALTADDEITALGSRSFARTNFPFAASFMQQPGTGLLQLTLDYDPLLLRPEQISAYLGYYARTLAAIARDPQARYEQADLLSAAERRLLLRQLPYAAPAPQPDLSAPRCAHELFAAQAALKPAAPAVVLVDPLDSLAQHSLSYAALDQRSQQLAHHLHQHQRQHPAGQLLVGLYLPRTPELIVAILGVLKAGGAYVPLDPTYPPERLRYMLADAGVALVLTEQHLAPALAALAPADTPLLCLDSAWPTIAATQPDGPLPHVEPEQLAYVIYTSGSTGQPKGVLVPHRGIGNLARAQIAAFEVRPDSRVLQFAALSFDATVSEIWMALLAGATLYLAPREALLPGPGLLDLLQRHAIDVVTLPPSVLAALPQPADEHPLPALRTLVVAGEACPPELIARWGRGRRLLNAYGPTETTVCATIAVCEDAAQRPPIGRPIANTSVYLLDQRMQPVPVGVAGELYLGGVGLAHGYLGRPALTASTFVPNPFTEPRTGALGANQAPSTERQAPSIGARLYRTGDLGRWLPDGQLDYLGRRDEQIKLRGFRIEPGEIEHALGQHPAVQQCAVVVQTADTSEQDGAAHRRLVAYVVGAEPRTENQEPGSGTDGSRFLVLGSQALRDFLAERLPGYMIPAAFVLLDALPLSPSGKIDRKALERRSLEPQAAAGASDGLEPRDRWELEVARLWQDLLGSGPVSVDDDFFKRGGDSLLAVRLVARIEQELGRRIPVAALINAPTIAQVAALLRQQPAEQRWSPLVAIQPGADRRPLFCVHPIGGHVLCYIKLAHEIGADQPFYGLQARGLEDEQTPPGTIAAMAADYLAAIRTVQPQGPYLLSGWSFGGVVALEMAQQLLRQGEQVDLLALLDSSLEPPIKAAPTPTEETLQLAWGLGGIFGKDLGITADDLCDMDQETQLAFLLERGRSLELVPADIGREQLQRYLEVFRASTRAAHSYLPQSYPLPILLFDAAEADPELRRERLDDWRAVAAGGLTIETVPGNHYSMMRTPEQMAQRLRQELDQLLSGAGSIATTEAR